MRAASDGRADGRARGACARRRGQTVEAADVFVGRYLLLTTVAYVGVKFVHFKIFDPFPF